MRTRLLILLTLFSAPLYGAPSAPSQLITLIQTPPDGTYIPPNPLPNNYLTPVNLSATDSNGNALTYVLLSYPAHGVLYQADPLYPGTPGHYVPLDSAVPLTGLPGVLYYLASPGFSGTDSFTLKSNDGQSDSPVGTLTLTGAPVPTLLGPKPPPLHTGNATCQTQWPGVQESPSLRYFGFYGGSWQNNSETIPSDQTFTNLAHVVSNDIQWIGSELAKVQAANQQAMVDARTMFLDPNFLTNWDTLYAPVLKPYYDAGVLVGFYVADDAFIDTPDAASQKMRMLKYDNATNPSQPGSNAMPQAVTAAIFVQAPDLRAYPDLDWAGVEEYNNGTPIIVSRISSRQMLILVPPTSMQQSLDGGIIGEARQNSRTAAIIPFAWTPPFIPTNIPYWQSLGTCFVPTAASPQNLPPVVNVGSDQIVTAGTSFSFNPSVSDDGLPNPPGALSYLWHQLSGPVSINFSNAIAANPSALFNTTGVYGIQLSVSDGDLTTVSSMTVTVTLSNTPVTGQPSHVSVTGTQLLVAKRLPTGALAPASPYTIQGVTWSPATRSPANGPDPLNPANSTQYGFFFDWAGRNPQGHDIMNYWLRNEVQAHYAVDIPLMAQMNVKTVRVYGDFGDSAAQYQAVLDTFYANGIMVIMDIVNSKADIDSGRYLQLIPIIKNHPAILMWEIGNEWNFSNLFGYPDMLSAIAAANQTAGAIKALDPNHPVSSSLGDKFAINAPGPCGPDNPNSDIPTIVNGAPNVDLWGINVYRGATFGTIFNQWKAISSKPFYFSEFGADSFKTTQFTQPFAACTSGGGEVQVQAGAEDQSTQATFDVGLWNEIVANTSAQDPSKSCAGGVVFNFNDQLWKVGNFNVGLGNLVNYNAGDTSYNVYNPDGFAAGGSQPDGVFNEEYFGLVNADRQPKQVYQALKTAFAGAPVGGENLTIDSITATPNPVTGTQTRLTLTFHGGLAPYNFLWSEPTQTARFDNPTSPSPTLEFSSAGTYTIQLSVSDFASATVTQSISVLVPRVFTTLTIQDPGPVVVGTAYPLVAVAADQFLVPINPQPPVIWSTDAGASIDSGTGLFQAQTPGPHVVIAHAGAVSGQRIFTVQQSSAAPGPLSPPVIDGFVPFGKELHRADTLTLRLSGGAPDRLDWVFTSGSATPVKRFSSVSAASSTGLAVTTLAPALALSNAPLLTDGAWHVSVTASNSAGASAAVQGDFVLVADDLSGVRVYPNPWRRSRDLGVNPVHFDPLPNSARIRIFSISGRLVKDLGTFSGSATWDLKNDDGDNVASGLYLYLITDGQGNKERGKLVVIQ